MKLYYRLFLTFLLGSAAIASLFLFQSFSQRYFEHRNSVEHNLKTIEALQNQLDYEILKNALFLYTSYDDVNTLITKLRAQIKEIEQVPLMQTSHPATIEALQNYEKELQHKVNAVYDFQTSNTVIKNTTAAILLLQNRLLTLPGTPTAEELRFFRLYNQTANSILIAKSGMDPSMIWSLRNDIETLRKSSPRSGNSALLAQQGIAHFEALERTLPTYFDAFSRSESSALPALIASTKTTFAAESEKELRVVTYFSYFLVALFLLSLGLITFFMLRSEKESRRDALTLLGNRKAFEESLQRPNSSHLSLLLINIKKFKHYNDFYGTKAGDTLLAATADHIEETPLLGMRPNYFRLGADDFGILFERPSTMELEHIAKEFLEAFSARPIIIEGEIRTPSITVAASESAPLLETADMALKSRQPLNPIIYHPKLNLLKKIENNVTRARELQEALTEGRIVPYFQPIVNLNSNRIEKYEILGRIITPEGHARSIHPYLTIAQESNLYPELTRTILAKSLPTILKAKEEFSLNISIQDILNDETVSIVLETLKNNEGLGDRLIFEFLESEAIEDYDTISRFIAAVRHYGCRIAIDDFGSGYSNFARILNLTIDIIKIDGSLVRHLDTDPKALTVVETIIGFTRRASIATVAEFVHNEKIDQTVRAMKINWGQGFYYYEPSPDLVTT